MYSHHKCYEYKDLKEEWETALETGNKRFCPGCGVGGIKNDACTHMSWDSCQTEWCYFCGLEDGSLDKEDPNGNIYSHNVDWDSNPKRCPMYLTSINEVDDRWSESCENTCITFLHKLLTYKNINAFLSKHGSEKYEILCEVFQTVGSHGYDLEDVKQLDTTLIKR